MSYDPVLWSRFEFDHTPIYVRKDKPDWFVPNEAGDRVLRALGRARAENGNCSAQRFLHRLPDGPCFRYPGRASFLQVACLRELWFHITNRCNLSCTHCLFASSPQETAELPFSRILSLADTASKLGCRVFALTGGEPFIHREFPEIVQGLLAYEDAHVVVLTNGMNIRNCAEVHTWDPERFHLQISVDGLQENHDRIRGNGMFKTLARTLGWLKEHGIPFTVSMCVDRKNMGDMAGVVDFAANNGAGNVHFMWYFVRGRASADYFPLPDEIFENLMKASQRAEIRGIIIDNIETLKTQVLAPTGTIHDGTTSCWESAAIGPDGRLYPSAALVGVQELGVELGRGLEHAWKESEVFGAIRKVTAADLTDPMKLLLGGGDTDHSYSHKKTFMGDDPYIPLYKKLALWLITKEASRHGTSRMPQLQLKMGDLLESCGAHGPVGLVHSNCLLAVAKKNSLTVVKEFYSDAAADTKNDILNPVCYPEELMLHIPRQFRFRGYGCGSPVVDAQIQQGERVLDLGCGTGVECFIAARLAGERGKVTGVDMLDSMLVLARKALPGVEENLGYSNVEFRKSYLEALPLEDESFDIVLSNCVINLSVNKRRSYSEIFRVLSPGGRLVISDVVCETEPHASIQNDEVLRGECIAGALTQKDLVGILEETGFESMRILSRFPYRIVSGHPFFSLTYEAHKPSVSDMVQALYRGPLAIAITGQGAILRPASVSKLCRQEAKQLGNQVFILDEQGAPVNAVMESPCACFAQEIEGVEVPPPIAHEERFASGCMVCGNPLSYLSTAKKMQCSLLRAARCCQRESWIALRKAAELSKDMLPVRLCAEANLTCRQQHANKECFAPECPVLK